MDSIHILYKEIEIMAKREKLGKRKAMKNEMLLFSGELSFANFVFEYREEHDEAPSLATISKSLLMAQSTITALADRLQAKGVIEKIVSDKNKRITLVKLTPKGEFNLSETKKQRLSKVAETFNILGEDDTLEYARIIKKINDYYTEK